MVVVVVVVVVVVLLKDDKLTAQLNAESILVCSNAFCFTILETFVSLNAGTRKPTRTYLGQLCSQRRAFRLRPGDSMPRDDSGASSQKLDFRCFRLRRGEVVDFAAAWFCGKCVHTYVHRYTYTYHTSIDT